MRKGQNGECNVRNLRRVFFDMNSDVPAFKVRVFKWLWILNEILVVDIPTQILLTILLAIDHSPRCKLKVYIITHTKEKPSTTNWLFVRQWKS